jgi:hypothetical protein
MAPIPSLSTALVLVLATWQLVGCGDYVTKSDHDKADESQQAQIDALQAKVKSLEATFRSDVILNTEVHTDSGTWDVFGGSVSVEYSWRHLSVEGRPTNRRFRCNRVGT